MFYWILLVYVVGMIPAAVLDGWYIEKHDIRNAPPSFLTALSWPIMFIMFCFFIPVITIVNFPFAQLAKIGGWIAKRLAK